jgi:hypothetical protein
MAETLTPTAPSRWTRHHRMESKSSDNTGHVEQIPSAPCGKSLVPHGQASQRAPAVTQPSTVETTTSSRRQTITIPGDSGLGWESTCSVNFLRIIDCYAKTCHILQDCKQSYLPHCNIINVLHLTGNKYGALNTDHNKCTIYKISIQEFFTDSLTVQQCKKVKLSLFLIQHHTMKVYG